VVLGTGAGECGDAAGLELFSARWTFDGSTLHFFDVGEPNGGSPGRAFNDVLWGSTDWVKVE
jgi:hypothetical protein